jgi:hypothetical protein
MTSSAWAHLWSTHGEVGAPKPGLNERLGDAVQLLLVLHTHYARGVVKLRRWEPEAGDVVPTPADCFEQC